MKLMQTSIISLFIVFLMTAFMLSSCISDDSSSADAVPTITGTAAAGLPIVGTVSAKGANGVTASADIDSNGDYSLNVSGLTAPYVLFASGAVNGERVELYSTGVAAGNINITPVTNLIANEVFGGLDAVFENWEAESTTVNTAAIEAAETKIQTQLAPILAAYGISDDIDLMSVEFETDHSGMDAVLDILEITIDDNNEITITNTATGTQVTGDEAFSDTETTTIAQVISDTAGINITLQTLSSAFATEYPSAAVINDSVAPLYADDFLSAGKNKNEVLTCLANSGCLGIGYTRSAIIAGPMDNTEYDTNAYIKGYWVNIAYEKGNQRGLTKRAMVYNGTNWLFYGDRKWFSINFNARVVKRTDENAQLPVATGIKFRMDDDNNYAYGTKGVRSLIITGPGLSSNGLIMYRDYPETWYDIDGRISERAVFVLSDDSVISAIPVNSEYTIRVYNIEPNLVSLSDSPMITYTEVVKNKPFLNSELTANHFPVITSPTTHSLAELGIGNNIAVTWTYPTVTTLGWDVSYVGLDWGGGGSSLAKYLNPDSGVSSVTLDTTDNNINPVTWAYLSVSGFDIYGREIKTAEYFQ